MTQRVLEQLCAEKVCVDYLAPSEEVAHMVAHNACISGTRAAQKSAGDRVCNVGVLYALPQISPICTVALLFYYLYRPGPKPGL